MSESEWRLNIRLRMKRDGITQQRLADLAEVSQGCIEAWLASPEKTWARSPSYVERVGLMEIVNRSGHARRQTAGTTTKHRQHWSRNVRTRWNEVNWGQRDETIAASLGVSATAVGARRKLAGAPAQPRKKSKWAAQDWSLSDAEIARQHGITKQAANQARKNHDSKRP